MSALPFALQLYTVRDHLDRDVAGTLARVKQIGYDFVEAGGTFGLTDAAFQGLLEGAGLKAISAHTGYEAVTADTPSVVAMARTYGVPYVVIGGIDPKLTPDEEGWRACGRALDAAGARLRAEGIQLCYHNHAHEFQSLAGKYPLDLLLDAARPENLAWQLDTFWVRYAGLDPVTFIKQRSGRCPLLHVKDMTDPASRGFAEVGAGILDWPAIFAAGQAAGVRWYIVEQDTCATDSVMSAAISAAFMARQ